MEQPPSKKGAAGSKKKRSAQKGKTITARVTHTATSRQCAKGRLKNGRPGEYGPELTADLLGRLASGESVRSICSDPDMPAKSTVFRWVLEGKREDAHPELKFFSDQYETALRIKAFGWADEILEVADDGTNDWMEKMDKEGGIIGWQVNGEAIQRSRLRADVRKWLLSKVLPKLYGDKLIVGGDQDNPVKHEHEHKLGSWDEIDRRMKALENKELLH